MKGCKFAVDKDVLCARQMTGWNSNVHNSSAAEFELWRNVGPSAFQLQETV